MNRTKPTTLRRPSAAKPSVPPAVLLDDIEAAEGDGNDERVEGLLCGAVKQLKMNRAKPDNTLYLSLMFLAKIKPNVFATEGIIEALCSLLRRDASINFKAKGNSLVSVLACNLLMAAYEEDENWPEIFVKVYIEDSLGERIWVDSSHCKNFVDNIQTAFGTKMPPKSMLLQADPGRTGPGDLSADFSQYEELAEGVEDYVLDVLRDQLNRRQPMDNVSRNLLRLLTATCGFKEARLMAVQRLEMWLQNPKLNRPAQDLLMSMCMNCNTHGADDMEVISILIKIRLKPKVLLNHYMLCVRELLNAHKDNLGTMVKLERFVIQVTDLLTVSMMLGITAQVKEAGIAWDKGEKKNLEVLRSFQNQIGTIQRDAVWWLHTVVPSISKVGAKDYVHCLHKVLFTEQPETYYKWDNWPPESDRK
ncbi:hypothetical protein CRUP_024974 [Coryphaenoides rupestris]|nr:hypothetical protein CRUP_024974 [Coryphaenoides rupestris]